MSNNEIDKMDKSDESQSEILKLIGKGSFSNVYLCCKKKSPSILFFEEEEYEEKEEGKNINLRFDSKADYYIIKEININNLVKKYITKTQKPRAIFGNLIQEELEDTITNNITPYNKKRYIPNNNNEDEYYFKRLTELIESEIEILQKLDHPNIIKFFSSHFDNINSIYSIHMEYCNKGDMYNILKNNSLYKHLRNSFGGFNQAFINDFLSNTVDALKYLHNKNIIHRDIKLQNILIATNQIDKDLNENEIFIYKLTDFGFACFDLESNLHCSLSVSDYQYSASPIKKKYYKLCGTPYYMAPEVILNIENFEQLLESKEIPIKFYDKKIDLWSFGICLYELIFNSLPYKNIEDITDLKALFSNKSTQKKIYKTIDKSDIINYKIKNILKGLLTINPINRLSANDLFNIIHSDNTNNYLEKSTIDLQIININEDNSSYCNLMRNIDFKENNNNTINVHLCKDIISEPIKNNNNNNIYIDNAIKHDNIQINLESWIIETKNEIESETKNEIESEINFIDSYEKINRASSMIMKMSIDSKFFKWLKSSNPPNNDNKN